MFLTKLSFHMCFFHIFFSFLFFVELAGCGRREALEERAKRTFMDVVKEDMKLVRVNRMQKIKVIDDWSCPPPPKQPKAREEDFYMKSRLLVIMEEEEQCRSCLLTCWLQFSI